MKLIPAVILIACYFGNENPEKTDKILFKNNKNKHNKRTTNAFRDKKIKKESRKALGLLRLVALTQSLLSLIEDYQKLTREYDENLMFYNQINDLVEEGFLTKTVVKDLEPSKIKFLCNVEKNGIMALCKKLNLKFFELLFNGNQKMES